MIQITIYKNEEDEPIGFCSKGHAGFASEGQDIVCAAASVLIINTINAITQFADDKTMNHSSDSGFIEYRLKGRPTKEAALLLDAMILGLTTMEADEHYTDYIDIIFEEV